jgi:hypothetical protein
MPADLWKPLLRPGIHRGASSLLTVEKTAKVWVTTAAIAASLAGRTISRQIAFLLETVSAWCRWVYLSKGSFIAFS